MPQEIINKVKLRKAKTAHSKIKEKSIESPIILITSQTAKIDSRFLVETSHCNIKLEMAKTTL